MIPNRKAIANAISQATKEIKKTQGHANYTVKGIRNLSSALMKTCILHTINALDSSSLLTSISSPFGWKWLSRIKMTRMREYSQKTNTPNDWISIFTIS